MFNLFSRKYKLFIYGFIFSILVGRQVFAYDISEKDLKEARLYLVIQGNTTLDKPIIEKISSRVFCINGYINKNPEIENQIICQETAENISKGYYKIPFKYKFYTFLSILGVVFIFIRIILGKIRI